MKDLTDILAEFHGKSPDDIAAMVKRRGIKGRAGTTYGCPMALLLHGTHSGAFIIGRRFIVRRSGNAIQKSRTPTNVSAFVRKFDIGAYPDLIAPPPRCINKGRAAPRASGPSGSSGKHGPRVIRNHISKLVDRFRSQP